MNPTTSENVTTKLEILREAARRANWDARYGPPHLRSGRFRPEVPVVPREDDAEAMKAEREASGTATAPGPHADRT